MPISEHYSPIKLLPSPSYAPGKPGDSIRRLNPKAQKLYLNKIPRGKRPLRYNDQLPIPGLD